jgi:antitoxin component of RelBE/YafQ-DinJ toxin-antitoxin module
MQTPEMAKDTMLRVRLDDDDRARLELLAKHYAVSASTVVRMLIKRDADGVALATRAASMTDAEFRAMHTSQLAGAKKKRGKR